MNPVKNTQGLDGQIFALGVKQALRIGGAGRIIILITSDKCQSRKAWVKFCNGGRFAHHDGFIRIQPINERDNTARHGISINIV